MKPTTQVDNQPSGVIDRVRLEIAGQYAPRRWRSAIADLVSRLHSGQSLADVVQDKSWPCAPELRVLIAASLNASEPTSNLLDNLQLRARVQRHWATLLRGMLYPVLLTALALAVCLGVGLVGIFIAEYSELMTLFQNWGLRVQAARITLIRDQANSIFGIALCSAWCVAIILVLRLICPRWAQLSVISGMPLYGRLYRWLLMMQLLGRIESFVRDGKTLPNALTAVAAGYRYDGMEKIVESLAQRIGAGMPLGEALKSSVLSDGLCCPALGQLDTGRGDFSVKLKNVREFLDAMAVRRSQLLASFSPTIVLLVAGSLIWNTIQCYFVLFLAIIQLISSLA